MSAFDKAVDLLARRQQTTAELRRKLRQRGYADVEIEETLLRLADLRYVDDDKTAKDWASDMAARGGRGRRRAVEKLISRGIAPEVANREVAQVWDDSIEREHASRALRKLMRSSRNPSQTHLRNAKLYRSLVSRGFDPEIVRGLIAALPEEQDDFGEI